MNLVDALADVVGIWWEDPELNGLRRLPARTARPVEANPDRTLSLDGTWSFALAAHPLAEPGPAHEITVPGCWTMQGVDDLPHYTNVVMPFPTDPPIDPPHVPPHNPTGHYRRSFDLPATWADHKVILHVGGAESAAALWCNDRFVGIMTDSRLASEFDLTDHLQPGENTLLAVVPRWSAHTWVEDQDHWHHGGLHRSISLRAVPAETHLEDVVITTDYNPETRAGSLRLDARVASRTANGHAGTTVRVTVDGLGVFEAPTAEFDRSSHLKQMEVTYSYPGPIARIRADLAKVEPWSHEAPRLYEATVELLDAEGGVVDQEQHRIGFTRTEVVGAELLLNGVPVTIVGVNRHDHHPDTGKAQTVDELWQDVREMKAAGMNSVRTAHYPPSPALLDACDELGLWVICEANLESHARWKEVSRDARYQTVFVERVQRMVATHRNHASIMGWSLGNESGHGPCHDAAATWVRAADPSRFVQYEGSVRNPFLRDPTTTGKMVSSDVVCPMYPTVEEIVRWATERPGGVEPDAPLIMCEFSHAMGNSNGDLDRYWAAIEANHGLQGGFIWDWKDQGLTRPDGGWGYGGHFDDDPNDGDFCCNGLVGPDGIPRPAVEELRYLTRTVVSAWDGDRRELTITNRRSFTPIDDLAGRVEQALDGEVVWSTPLSVAGLAPGSNQVIAIDPPPIGGKAEANLTVSWADQSGNVVAWDQHQIQPGEPLAPLPPGPANAEPTGLSVGPYRFAIDAETGLLGELTKADGATLLLTGPRLSLWRAPTDNDGDTVGPRANDFGSVARWLEAGLNRLDLIDVEQAADGTRRTRWQTGNGWQFTETLQLALAADGRLSFAVTIDVPEPAADLPRVGVAMTAPAAYQQLTWFGPGPWETYHDRANAPVRRHTQTVAEQYVPYLVPQHHGTHLATRWAHLTDPSNPIGGLRLSTNQHAVTVSNHSVEALTAASVPGELPIELDAVHLHIDADLRGVGTAACGPDTSHRTMPGEHQLRWDIHPA